jgi:hypothetical protein
MEMDEPIVRESLLMFYFHALGFRYALLIPLAAFVAFVLALILVIRGKGPALGPALVLIVPMAVYIGIFAGVDGIVASCQVLAITGGSPNSSEIARGVAMSFVAPMLAMFLSIPAYLAAVIGTTIRSFRGT